MNVPALLPVRRVSLLFHLFPLQMMNLLCELRRPLRKRVAIRVTALPSGSHLHIRRRVVKASQTRVTYNRLSVSAPPHPSFTPSSSSLSFFLLSLGPFSLLVFLILRSYERWHARPGTSSAVRQKPAETPVWFSWLLDSRSKHLTASPPQADRLLTLSGSLICFPSRLPGHLSV